MWPRLSPDVRAGTGHQVAGVHRARSRRGDGALPPGTEPPSALLHDPRRRLLRDLRSPNSGRSECSSPGSAKIGRCIGLSPLAPDQTDLLPRGRCRPRRPRPSLAPSRGRPARTCSRSPTRRFALVPTAVGAETAPGGNGGHPARRRVARWGLVPGRQLPGTYIKRSWPSSRRAVYTTPLFGPGPP